MNEPQIIREIPIFVTQNLADRLWLYQYGLESNCDIKNNTIVECRLKQDLEVELDIERDVDSANYNKSRGEQMAINVDGKEPQSNPVYARKLMDKETLVSKRIDSKGISIGMLMDGELHLCPAAAVALLRPSFGHLDKTDRRLKQENKEAGEEASEEEEELQAVTVKFARNESERARKAREKSFSYLSKQSAKQTSYRSDYFHPTSNRSELERRKLMCSSVKQRVVETRPLGAECVEVIGEVDGSHSAHGLPLTNTSILPSLLERVRTIMIEARVVQLGTLHRLLGPPSNAVDIMERIKVVQHVAVLVQGCWVVQSDLLISKEETLLRCARDYLLYLFTKSRTVSRKRLMEVVRLGSEAIVQLLEEVSVLNVNKEWEFLLPTDHAFLSQHSEVAQRQQAKWELRSELLLSGLSGTGSTGGPSNAAPARHRRRSGRDSMSSDTDSDAKRSFPNPKPRRTRVSESKSSDHT